jgi:HD-like signal output (HDOD) protein
MTNWTAIRKSVLGDQKRRLLPPKLKVPTLPAALMKFCRRADDPRVSPCELASIIETDAGLTCNLLRHVNSSKFALRNKAATAQQALTLLGIRATRLVLMTTAVQAATAGSKGKLVDLTAFANSNLERALFARELAGVLKADVDLAFAASMMQDFLLPMLSDELSDEYKRFFDLQRAQPMELARREQETFGWSHALAAGSLMWEWGFPDDLVCAVLLHHKGLEVLTDPDLARTSVSAVAIAALLPDPFQQSPGGIEILAKLNERWPALALETMADRVEPAFREQGDAHHVLALREFAKPEAEEPAEASEQQLATVA